MLNSQINKIQAITSDTLIVGVDIAKNIQWAQFINFRGIEVSKHICFENNYSGFNSIMEKIEKEMAQELEKIGYKDILTSIPGIGIISAASFIGEIGDPKRFSNPQQIIRLAGYNLVEDSSGKHKSKTMISKHGRKILRTVLYNKISLIVVCKNQEIKLLYKYLIRRKENPLKKKQALIVISGKMVKIVYSLIKKEEVYDKEKVLGIYRKQQIVA